MNLPRVTILHEYVTEIDIGLIHSTVEGPFLHQPRARIEPLLPPVTTEGDKVQRAGLLIPVESPRHGESLTLEKWFVYEVGKFLAGKSPAQAKNRA